MAEFCIECLSKEFDCRLSENDVISDVDLCEVCGELKMCVVGLTMRGKIKTFLAERIGRKNILRKILRM